LANTKTPNILIETLGWYGAGAIIFAYMLVSFGTIQAEGYMYQLLNLTGAVGIITSSWAKRDKQPVVLNAFWMVIAAIALLRLLWV
jgi:hypothetical protein